MIRDIIRWRRYAVSECPLVNVLFFFLLYSLGRRCLSPGKVAEMKLKIEVEKKALVQKKDMEEEEKNKVAQELEKREGDLVAAE